MSNSLDKKLLSIAQSTLKGTQSVRDSRGVVSKGFDVATNKSYSKDDQKAIDKSFRDFENKTWKPKMAAHINSELIKLGQKKGTPKYQQSYDYLFNQNYKKLQAAKTKAQQNLGTVRNKNQSQRDLDNTHRQNESIRNKTSTMQNVSHALRDTGEAVAGALGTGGIRPFRYALQTVADIGENDDGGLADRGAKALKRQEDSIGATYPGYTDIKQNGSFTQKLAIGGIEQLPQLAALGGVGAGAGIAAKVAGASNKVTGLAVRAATGAAIWPLAYGDGNDTVKQELESATSEQLASAEMSQDIYKAKLSKNIKGGMSEKDAHIKARDQTISEIAETGGKAVGLFTLAISLVAPGVGSQVASRFTGGAGLSTAGQKVFNRLAARAGGSKAAQYSLAAANTAQIAGRGFAEEYLQEAATDYVGQKSALDVGVRDKIDWAQNNEAGLMGGILGAGFSGGMNLSTGNTGYQQGQARLAQAQQQYADTATQVVQLRDQLEATEEGTPEHQQAQAQFQEARTVLATMKAEAQKVGIPASALARRAPRIDPATNINIDDFNLDNEASPADPSVDNNPINQDEPAAPDENLSEQELDAQDSQIAELLAEQAKLDEAIQDGSGERSVEESAAAAQSWYDKQRGIGQEGLSGVVARAKATEQDNQSEQLQTELAGTRTSINDYINEQRSQQQQLDNELEQDKEAAQSYREKREIVARIAQRDADRAEAEAQLQQRVSMAEPYAGESFDTTVIGADGAPFNLARFWSEKMSLGQRASAIDTAFGGALDQNLARAEWQTIPEGVQKNIHEWMTSQLDGVRQSREANTQAVEPVSTLVEQPKEVVPTASGLTMPTQQSVAQLTDENPVINVPAPSADTDLPGFDVDSENTTPATSATDRETSFLADTGSPDSLVIDQPSSANDLTTTNADSVSIIPPSATDVIGTTQSNESVGISSTIYKSKPAAKAAIKKQKLNPNSVSIVRVNDGYAIVEAGTQQVDQTDRLTVPVEDQQLAPTAKEPVSINTIELTEQKPVINIPAPSTNTPKLIDADTTPEVSGSPSEKVTQKFQPIAKWQEDMQDELSKLSTNNPKHKQYRIKIDFPPKAISERKSSFEKLRDLVAEQVELPQSAPAKRAAAKKQASIINETTLDKEQQEKPTPSGDWRSQVGGNEIRDNKDGITVRKHDRVVHIRGANSIAANKKARELASQEIRELHYIAAKENPSDPFSEASIWLDGEGDMIRKKGTKKPSGALLTALKLAKSNTKPQAPAVKAETVPKTKKTAAKKSHKPAETIAPKVGEMKFSRATGLSETAELKDLVVAHNIKSAGVIAANDLGGLAAPSIAVVRSGISDFTKYGEITLLASPLLLTGKDMPTFDSDIYSPRQPRPEYDINEKRYKAFVDTLTGTQFDLNVPSLRELSGTHGADNFITSHAIQYEFLDSISKAPKLKKSKVRPEVVAAANLNIPKYDLYESSDIQSLMASYYKNEVKKMIEKMGESEAGFIRSIYFDESGKVDRNIADKFLQSVIDYQQSKGRDFGQLRQDISKLMRDKSIAQKYEEWATQKFNELVDGKKLNKGITKSGDKKYSDYNLKNVVTAMTKQLNNGEDMKYGAGSVRSVYANEMKTLDDIKSRREQIIPEKDFEKIKDESNEVFNKVLEKLKPFYKYDAASWNYADEVGASIAEGDTGIRDAFGDNKNAKKIINDLTHYLSELPTEYFEAKAQRAVQFSEFDTAIVPKNADPKAVEILKDAGLKIKRYDQNVEGDKNRIIAKQTNLLFSKSDTKSVPASTEVRGRTDTTAKQVIEVLQKRLGKEVVSNLIKSGTLHIRNLNDFAAADGTLLVPSDVEGIYYDGKVTLIADNLDADTIVATLLHELGGHAGLQNMMSPVAYNNLMKGFDSLVESGNKYAVAAKERAEASTDTETEARDEYIPYLITEYTQATEGSRNPDSALAVIKRYINRVVAAVRAWLNNTTGLNLKITPNDIQQLAEKMVKRIADQNSEPLVIAGIENTGRSNSLEIDGIKNNPQEYSAIRKQQDDTDKWMKASNGNDTNLNEQQWLQVRTPEFKKWFGNSKVVDINGDPLIVYHGTTKSFAEFNTTDFGALLGKGSYFTAEITDARQYSGGGTGIVPAYISVENPYYVESSMEVMPSRKEMLDKGHDGVIYKNKEGGVKWVVAHKPTQIKSSNDNNGDFDGSNPDIRYSRRYSNANQNEDAATRQQQASRAVRLGAAAANAANAGTIRILRRHIATPQHVALLNPDFKLFADNVQARLAYENHEAGKVQIHVPEIWQKRLIVGKAKKSMERVSQAIFDGTMADRVWDDTELADNFKLSPEDIDLYHRFRDSINDSLGNMTVDTISALAKGTKLVNIETIMRLKLQEVGPAMHNVAIQKLMTNELEKLDKGGLLSKAAVTRMQGQLTEVFAAMDAVSAKYDQLIEQGYAPLMRFGNYAVEVRNKDTNELDLFELYEGNDITGPLAQWKAIKDLEKKYDLGKYIISKGTLNPDAFKQFTDKGLNPETVQLFASELGLDTDGAIQAYLKVAISNRSALKRLIHRKKIAGYSEDMPRVVSAFVMSNARHSGRMLYNGEIENNIQKIKDGDLQGEAQNVFKNMEDPQEEYAGIRGTMFHWFMAFSPAFLLLNLTQPFTQTIPKLSAYSGAGRAHADMAQALGIVGKYSGKATWDATKSVAGKGDPNWQGFEDNLPQWVKKEDYLRMSREGHLDPQNVWMIRGLERGKTGVRSGIWGGFEAYAGWPAEVSEGINRRSTMIAAFKTAKRMGAAKLKAKGFNSEYEFAVSIIQQTQGIYNKGNRSGLARGTGKLGQFGPLVMVFKQFTINYVEQMIRHSRDKEFKSLALMMLWQFGIAGMFGLPFVDDLRDIIEGMWYRVFGKSLNLVDELQNVMGKTAANNLMYGIPSNNNPIDFYGRSSMGNLLPLTDFARPNEGDWGEVIGASSSFFENFYTASKYLAEGRFRDATVAASPRYIKDAVNGYEIYTTGSYRNHKGDKVMDMSKADGLIKGLGQFNPASNAKSGRERSEGYHMKNMIKHNQDRYSLKLAEAIYEENDKLYDKVYSEMDAWNERNEDPYQIDIEKVEKSAEKRVEKKDFGSAERNEKALPDQLESYFEGKE